MKVIQTLLSADQWTELLNRPRSVEAPPVAPVAVPVETDRIIERLDGFRVRLSGHFSLPTLAMAAMDRYQREYDSTGYGTHFAPLRQVGDYFIVNGGRHASCD